MSEGGGRERRKNARHLACVPVHIHNANGAPPHTALIRELSVSGAQILTQSRFEVGARIELALYIRDTENAEPAVGTVIRVQRRPQGGMWPIVVAIEFDQPLTEFEQEIKDLAEKTAPIARG